MIFFSTCMSICFLKKILLSMAMMRRLKKNILHFFSLLFFIYLFALIRYSNDLLCVCVCVFNLFILSLSLSLSLLKVCLCEIILDRCVSTHVIRKNLSSRCSMRQLLKSFSWYLYGGVSCYCLQRFLVDFLYIPNDENELFRSGDIVVLDVWHRLELERYS